MSHWTHGCGSARGGADLQKQYLKFYWPLALMGVALLVSRQLQNRTLASYPDAKRELAVFALAFSTFGLFGASLAFVPQMTNVLVRSARSYRRCRAFTLLVSLLVTLPVAALALTDTGEAVLHRVFRIDERMLAPVVRYMRLFLPLIVVRGVSQFCTGLLVQVRRTGIVTALQVLRLALAVTVLGVGWGRGWEPVVTLSLSQIVPSLVHAVLSYAVHVFVYSPPFGWKDRDGVPCSPADATGETKAGGGPPVSSSPGETERCGARAGPSSSGETKRQAGTTPVKGDNLTWRDMLDFFWPVAATSTMFMLSRPIIYSFLTRLPDGEAEIASVAVTFSFAMMFHMPINQFRHLFATFGGEDPAGVRRFMLKVMAIAVALMVLAAATPLARLFFRHALNVKGDLLERAVEAFRPLCLIPLVVTLRNYYHGIALVGRRTVGMAAGGIARNVVIYAVGLALFGLGWLDHVTGASLLVVGFATEAVVVFAFTRLSGGTTTPLLATPRRVASGEEPDATREARREGNHRPSQTAGP